MTLTERISPDKDTDQDERDDSADPGTRESYYRQLSHLQGLSTVHRERSLTIVRKHVRHDTPFAVRRDVGRDQALE